MKEFVGIWQDSPEIASGWSDTYQFFDNGDFVYRYNQMICDKRTLNYSGTWEIVGDKIEVTVSEKTIVVGGKLVPSSESCGSDYEIEGGEEKKERNIESYTIQLSTMMTDTIGPDDDQRILASWNFDKKRFWKMESDPSKY